MMRRRFVGVVFSGWCLLASCVVACSGDDTNPPLPDAGAPDATVDAQGEGGGSDAMAQGDAPVTDGGAGDAASACVLIDAAVFTDAEVQAGLKIVTARKCQQCHGNELQGNQNGLPSTNAEGGTAYPPDLTPDPVTGLGCWTNEEIECAFLYGVDKAGQPMCNPMPRFGEEGDAGIDEAGAGAVVAYLRSIPAVVTNVQKNPACPAPVPVDAGPDAGTDAGPVDAGTDAGPVGSEAGPVEAGADATADAGDAGAEDAGGD
jgi:hypothetical protein